MLEKKFFASYRSHAIDFEDYETPLKLEIQKLTEQDNFSQKLYLSTATASFSDSIFNGLIPG
jgi:hypothetical protein